MLSKRGDGGESGGSRRLVLPLGGDGGAGGSGSGGGDGGEDDAAKARRLYDGNIEVIKAAARSVARALGYSPEDIEDFCQAALLHLLQKPQILARFRGGDDPEDGCSLKGYLKAVLLRYAQDIYRHLVGKWHSSAEAKRLGVEAEELEALRYRDKLTPEYAVSKLLDRYPDFSREKAYGLLERLKPRGLRESVGDGPLETLPAASQADDGAFQHELEKIQRKVQKALEEALAELELEDRVLVKAIFGKGLSVKDFALLQGIRQRQMYSRFDKLRMLLRKKLESLGIGAEEALRLVGWSESALSLDLGSDDERRAEKDDSEDPEND